MSPFPHIPKLELEVIADRSAEREGFLTLKRYDLSVVNRVNRAERGQSFRYDIVDRRALDASVMAAHHVDAQGRRCVYLRSAVRPPIALRSIEPALDPVLWELPAGLIEPGEEPRAAAARELEEELGFTVAPEAMKPLGEWTLPCPALVGEMHWFFHVAVDPSTRNEPGGDGSPLEEGACIVSMPIADALAGCREGRIRDAKTELALRRLADVLLS